MSEQSFDYLETQLFEAGRNLPYPATPDISSQVSQALKLHARRRIPIWTRKSLALTTALLLVLLAGLMAVPSVRAQVLEFLQIGAIRIFFGPPTPTPEVIFSTPTLTRPSTAPQTGEFQSMTPLPTASPRSTPTPLSSLMDLTGETTLDEARIEVNFPIRLPTYPEDLGPPDRVYLQEDYFSGPAVLLVWMDKSQPNEVLISLLELGPGTLARKYQPPIIRETEVNGKPALWTEGPHLLLVGPGDYQTVRLVINGNLLIWQEGEFTYRLESELPLENAVRIAESLSPP